MLKHITLLLFLWKRSFQFYSANVSQNNLAVIQLHNYNELMHLQNKKSWYKKFYRLLIQI